MEAYWLVMAELWAAMAVLWAASWLVMAALWVAMAALWAASWLVMWVFMSYLSETKSVIMAMGQDNQAAFDIKHFIVFFI